MDEILAANFIATVQAIDIGDFSKATAAAGRSRCV